MSSAIDTEVLLEVDQLQISLSESGRKRQIVDSASFTLASHDTLGIVGESGSGKSTLCRALIGTLERHGARVTSGRARYRGTDLVGASAATWRRLRGSEIAYVPQSSLAGLNPVVSVGSQLATAVATEAKERGERLSKRQVLHRAVELLDLVHIARPTHVMAQRPHELSGGMRQRVMIAGALARSPSLLIADEPTTALDVQVQKKILDLIMELTSTLKMALIFVSHDLAVVDDLCSRTVVMYAGTILEIGKTRSIREAPLHPYTRGLRAASVLDESRPLNVIPGEAPGIGEWPSGCRFWPRCNLSVSVGGGQPAKECVIGRQPDLREFAGGQTACLFTERITDRAPGQSDEKN